ncbi:hypothetical protein [Microbacterium terrisoli]|uniref:hypothetical protein n=1 Tax=Microbacterium terrisoli TaxID=3242192 RepID=UPI002804E27F|nr:hypothetical protein [Microbacterium protaetiae]
MKLTSSEWELALGVLVLDPDGWDRQRLEESWAEFITEGEFRARCMLSTTTTDPLWVGGTDGA